MHGSPQIHDNLYFDLKVYFIYFWVFKLEREERKFLGNRERKKMVGCHDINNKNDHI